MNGRDARLVLREARSWAEEGLIGVDALHAIEERYTPLAETRDDDEDAGGFASRALYGVGGVLLGAAAIALVVFMDVEQTAHWWFLALGVLGIAGGAGAHRALGNEGLGDALLVASLIPFAAVAVPLMDRMTGGPEEALTAAGVLVPLALVWWRRDARLVPAAAAVAFFFGGAFMSFLVSDAPDTGAWAWALLGTGGVALALGMGRAWDAPWRGEVLAVGAVGLAACTIGIIVAQDLERPEGLPQLIVGAVQLVLLMLGLGLSERGLVAGAAAVLTVDAIVFAFDVGGLLVGTGVLVTAAAVALWQAEMIRRFVKGT